MYKAIAGKFGSFFLKGHERTIAAKKNVALSLILKGGSILTNFTLIPLTINYVNPTQYGIWLTLSSVISWFNFLDIGLGNGLKNKLAESNALKDYQKSRIYVSTTYAALTIVAITVFLLFIVFNKYLNWAEILNISSKETDFNNLALLVAGIFCIQFVVQLINFVLTACHKPAKVSFLVLLGQFVSLIAILLLTSFSEGNLINLVLVLAGIPLLILVLASIWFYSSSYKFLAPSIKLVSLPYAKNLLTLGGAFFLIQLGQLVLYQTDNIIIAQLFGPDDVTTFNIAYKLLSSVLIIFTIIITPLWSAFTEAYAKKEFNWIKETFYKMQKVWFLTALLTLLLGIASPFIIQIWMNGMIQVSVLLSLAVAIYVISTAWQMLCCFLLNGINKFKLQLILFMICFIVNIPLAIFLGKLIGIEGVILSNIIVLVFIGLFLYIQCHKILTGQAKGIWNK